MNLPPYIKGVIFDLDGTLLKSLHVWQEVDRQFFKMHSLPLPEDYYAVIKAMELFEAAVYTKARFSIEESVEEIVQIWHDMVKEKYAFEVELSPHAKEYIKKLYDEGKKLAIATSSSKEIFMPCLKRHEIDKYFSSFTETREAKRGKNFPDPYLLSAAKLSLSPRECAVFEDIFEGIESAKSAGFFTVNVLDPLLKGEASGADLVIENFSELL